MEGSYPGAHKTNGTWEIVDLPPDRKPIGSKWTFKIKYTASGEIARFKARLCAKGFAQKQGIDYTETFSPVVRYDSIRTLLAIAAQNNLRIRQFDVKTAFLNGILNEDVYMSLPEGLEVTNSNKVCKLNKALYGLKQASRCWNTTFDKFLKHFDFSESHADKCIYTGTFCNSVVYLALYVDDGLLFAKSEEALNCITDELKKEFDITCDTSNIFVGMQITRNENDGSIFIHQYAYIERLLSKLGMSEARTIGTPAEPNSYLEPANVEKSTKTEFPYGEAVGSLMFLAILCRPDIAHPVNVCARYLDKYNDTHCQAVKRIMRYLKGTSNLGISYRRGGSNLDLVGYSDADFANDLETRRSTTGYVFELANGPITWCSQRQKTVMLSTTTAEYIAASEATKEAIWLRLLLHDIGHRQCNPTVIRKHR